MSSALGSYYSNVLKKHNMQCSFEVTSNDIIVYRNNASPVPFHHNKLIIINDPSCFFKTNMPSTCPSGIAFEQLISLHCPLYFSKRI